MYKHKPLSNPTLAGGAGILVSAAILRKLIDRNVLSKQDAHEVVLGALELIAENRSSWANVAREILEQDFAKEFPAK